MGSDHLPSAVSAKEIDQYVKSTMGDFANTERVHQGFARCVTPYEMCGLRPGGYISGPTIMHLADLAAWVAVFTHAGITPMAVTWDLHVTFLRPAIGGDLIAEATVNKFGRMTQMTVMIYVSSDESKPVATASVTYAVPRP